MKAFLIFLLFCASAFAEPISIAWKEGDRRVGHVLIPKDRSIDSATEIELRLAFEHFKELGVQAIVLELDTPGGEVFAAMNCSRILKEIDQKDHIPVIAWIHDWAISAGAMLAYSCRYIVTSTSASMGAAEPVLIKDGQMESASEKINSALRAEFANEAATYGRDPHIAEAMVDKDLFLVWRGDKVIAIDNDNEMRPSDTIIIKKGKLLTLRSEEMMKYGVADYLAQKEIWEEPFLQNVEVIDYSDWRVSFFAFLHHPAVASLLLMGLMLGIYLEVQNPGAGFPAVLGLICLGLILLTSFSVKAVNVLELIILATGVILLLVEIFVLPGFGICGILGIVMTLGGLFALMLPSMENFSFSWSPGNLNIGTEAILSRLAWLSAAVIAALIIIALLIRFRVTTKLPFFNKFILNDEQTPPQFIQPHKGEEGIATTSLRPAGKVEVHQKVYDAISEGDFVEKGQKIIVMRIEGNKLVVRPQ